jgi:hypothetical protein
MFDFGYVDRFASNRNVAPCEGVRVIKRAMGFLKRQVDQVEVANSGAGRFLRISRSADRGTICLCGTSRLMIYSLYKSTPPAHTLSQMNPNQNTDTFLYATKRFNFKAGNKQ